jgi:hypothetical protein
LAGGWWLVLICSEEKYCRLVASGWFVLREKYCWLVADKPNEQGVYRLPFTPPLSGLPYRSFRVSGPRANPY